MTRDILSAPTVDYRGSGFPIFGLQYRKGLDFPRSELGNS